MRISLFRLLCICALWQIVDCSCPSGYDLISDGRCFGKYTTTKLNDNSAITTAISYCNSVQGQVPSVHSTYEDTYLHGLTSSGSAGVVLGLVCDTESKKWKWSDGTALDFKPAVYSSVLNNNCANGCIWFSYVTNGNWIVWCDNDLETFDIVCTTQLPPVPVLPANGCYSFESDGDDGVCYQIGTTAESWTDAQLICKKLGGNLASIHNSNENTFVRRLAVANGAVHDVFLGATVSGKGGEYGWVDGTDWDYSNFYPGFPKTGFGDCIIMDTSTTTGQWMNMDCTAQIPVACVREPKPVELNATCSTETYKEGVIITSPGFPFSASMPCEYYLMADAGKKVEVEIAFLEANSCCDFLTIYDGYAGGIVLAKLTGALNNVTYTTTSSNIMRVAWQPNGGVNVRGLAMTFRGV